MLLQRFPLNWVKWVWLVFSLLIRRKLYKTFSFWIAGVYLQQFQPVFAQILIKQVWHFLQHYLGPLAFDDEWEKAIIEFSFTFAGFGSSNFWLQWCNFRSLLWRNLATLSLKRQLLLYSFLILSCSACNSNITEYRVCRWWANSWQDRSL